MRGPSLAAVVFAIASIAAGASAQQTAPFARDRVPPGTGWFCYRGRYRDHYARAGGEQAECFRERRVCEGTRAVERQWGLSSTTCTTQATAECTTWTRPNGAPEIACFPTHERCERSHAVGVRLARPDARRSECEVVR